MELILFNGKIYTMDEECPQVSAVFVRDGIIEFVGSDSAVLEKNNGNAKIIDLEGKCVIPGFNDSHMHLVGYAKQLNLVNLMGVTSIDELIERIRAFIDERNIPEGTSVFGRGWNQDFFGVKEYPSRYDIDRASDKHPIIISRACGHLVAANSLAIKNAGIDENTQNIPGGEILKDKSGVPTGIFTENASGLLYTEKNKTTIEEIKELIKLGAKNLIKYGVTSVQSDDFGPMSDVYNAYLELAAEKNLTVRVNQQCRAENYAGYKEIVELKKPSKEYEKYFKLGPIKIMADGSLGGRTAYMLEDYKDAPGNRGILIYTKEQLSEIVSLAHNSGNSVAIHAIGDGAIDLSLKCIEECMEKNPNPNLRHGIVHTQITNSSMLKRFARGNVIAYIQPIFIHADSLIAESRIGTEKASTSYAFKTLKDLGVHIPFGTDCPVEDFNPFANIYCAVTRKGLTGMPQNGFYPKEALSVYEAVYAYTVEGAYASFEENLKGRIKPGMFADMSVLSNNIFEIEPDEILKTEVLLTIFDGKQVNSCI